MIRGLSCGFFCMQRWQWDRTQPQSRWFEGCCCSRLTAASGDCRREDWYNCRWQKMTICTWCKYQVTSWQWRRTQPRAADWRGTVAGDCWAEVNILSGYAAYPDFEEKYSPLLLTGELADDNMQLTMGKWSQVTSLHNAWYGTQPQTELHRGRCAMCNGQWTMGQWNQVTSWQENLAAGEEQRHNCCTWN